MNTDPTTTPSDRPLKTSAAVFPLVLSACAVFVVAGLWLALGEMGTGNADRRNIGLVLLAVGSAAALLGAFLYAIWHELHVSRLDASRRSGSSDALLEQRLSQMSAQLSMIAEQQLLSDRAKSVAYRDKEREALRRAISEDLARADFDAARALVDNMEATYGNRAEADRIRQEINARREDVIRRLMVDAQDKIDRCCRSEDWTGAQQEAARFIALYGDYEPARRLPAEIEARRQAYKRQLLDRWHDCVLRHDGDAGMEVLRLLDPYLTPAEAERLAESARSVLNDRKSKLRENFTSAVTRRDWNEAIRIGETIQREFPNAKIAQEVAETMDTLRSRAAETAPA